MKHVARHQFALLIILVIVGQWCANSWPVKWREVVTSHSGRIFTAAILGSKFEMDVREWSSDLSSNRVLARPWSYYGQLHPNRDGTVMVFDEGSFVRGVDTSTGKELWRNEASDFRKAHILQDDRFVMLAITDQGQRLIAMQVLDIETGQLINEIQIASMLSANQRISKLYFVPRGLTFENKAGERTSYEFVDRKILRAANLPSEQELANCRYVFDPKKAYAAHRSVEKGNVPLPKDRHVRLTQRSTQDAAEITMHDASSGNLLYRKRVGTSKSRSLLLGILFVVGGVTWVAMLIRDSAQVTHCLRRRGPWNLGLLSACLMIATVPGLGEFVPRYAIENQPMRMLALPAAIFVWLLFVMLLGLRRPLYSWSAILCGCAVPLLLPSVMLGLLAGFVGLHSPVKTIQTQSDDQLRFRFNTGHLLLATSALAILMSVGLITIDLALMGVAYAVVLFAAIGLSLNRTVAMMTVGICGAILFALAAGYPHFNRAVWLTNHCVMLVLTFSFLSLYGYGLNPRHLAETPKEKPPAGIQQAAL